jgi:CheY-like chemotaxis protein
LVEDHVDAACALSSLLETYGHRIETANSLAAAIKAASTKCFDVIDSDLTLPDGSGLSLPQQQIAKNKRLGAIALSSPWF